MKIKFVFAPNGHMQLSSKPLEGMLVIAICCKELELWAPTGHLGLVDLGHDFFLALFNLREGLNHVLKIHLVHWPTLFSY